MATSPHLNIDALITSSTSPSSDGLFPKRPKTEQHNSSDTGPQKVAAAAAVAAVPFLRRSIYTVGDQFFKDASPRAEVCVFVPAKTKFAVPEKLLTMTPGWFALLSKFLGASSTYRFPCLILNRTLATRLSYEQTSDLACRGTQLGKSATWKCEEELVYAELLRWCRQVSALEKLGIGTGTTATFERAMAISTVQRLSMC